MNAINISSFRKEQNASLTKLESHKLIEVQRDILELIVTSSDYQQALDELCISAEGIVAKALGSIMVFNDSNTALTVRSAPSLTSEAKQQLSGLVPGENSGSCGTAVFTKTPQFISDTSSDKQWNGHRDLAVDLNIHACWSVPIVNRKKEVIGSFALSSGEKRNPSKFQENLMYTAAYLASLVLQREADEQALQNAAYYDHLTKLSNRLLFNIRLENAMARANRHKSSIALFYIDLDNFKQINDEFGHSVGDKVLSEIAQRMSIHVRREDLLARVGGDEFILLVEGQPDKIELKVIAEKIMQAFKEPIQLDKGYINLSACVGISLYPKNSMSANQLIACADKAMYIAKSRKKDKIQFFAN